MKTQNSITEQLTLSGLADPIYPITFFGLLINEIP